MKNIEFIKVFNEILNSEINNESLFINNDFNNFYITILNRMNIYNTNDVINYFENNLV